MTGDRVVRFRLEAATQGFQRGMGQARASTAQTSRTIGQSMRANQQAFQVAGAAALGLGAAAAAGLGSAAAAGAEFEAAMNQVRAVSGATGDEFQRLSETAKELGASTQFSATQAAEGLNFLAMAGFDATEATEALPGVLNLAAAGGMELAEAADIASNVLTGYGMEAAEIGRVTDAMAATFTSANTDLSQLGQAMSFVAPVANSAGLAFEETSAAIGMMSDAGIQGTRAGTSLRMAITRLLNPTGGAADVIEDLGINATTADGELRSLEDIVAQLESSGASTAEMMELFGQRAGPGMAALVDRGADSLSDLTTELEQSGGTAQRVAETQMEGLKGSVTELGSAWEGLKITVSEAGVGAAAETITDSLTGAVRAVEGLPDPVMRAATSMAALTAGTGLAGGGVMILGPQLAAGATQMRGLVRAAGGLRGMAAKGGAVGALVFAVQDLAAAWQDARDEARETVEQIIEDSGSAEEAVDRLEQSVREQAEEFGSMDWGRVANNVLGVVGAYRNFRDTLDAVGRAWETWQARSEPAERWAADVQEAINAVKTGTTTGMQAVLDTADRLGPSLMSSFGGMASHAGAAVESVEDLEDALDRLFGSALGLERATIAYQEMLVDLNGTLQENEATLSIASEAGRENRSAILDGVEAARDHAVAMMEDGKSTDEATAAMQQHVEDLKSQLRQAGHSEAAIRDYIDTLNLTPEDIRTTLRAETDRAKDAVREFQGLLASLPSEKYITARMAFSGAEPTPRASGGAVEPGVVYKVGEREPEYLTVGQPGMVHTAAQMDRILGATGGQLAGVPAGNGGSTTHHREGDTINVYNPVPQAAERDIARENRKRTYLQGR